jgi:hypothetical protein
MKKLFTIIAAVLLTVTIWAQSPQKMSYQAVIRNSSDQLVTNHAVGMRISILQGSVSGTVVYIEAQTPTTNANGLVCIEIGSGTGFDAINWANGPYFLKTEIDPTGGTNYTAIVGTSQLLSVPFALHSKSAETSTDAVKLTGDQTIVGNKTFTGITTVSTPVNATDAATKAYVDSKAPFHYVGENYGDGIVFNVYDNGKHGLIAAKDDSSPIRWYAGTYTNTMAMANGILGGKSNTLLIVANQGYGDGAIYAARACQSSNIYMMGLTDWYLPSKLELDILYSQKNVVGGFSNAFYWSSTESNSTWAWCQNFSTGVQNENTKENNFYIRAIRSF